MKMTSTEAGRSLNRYTKWFACFVFITSCYPYTQAQAKTIFIFDDISCNAAGFSYHANINGNKACVFPPNFTLSKTDTLETGPYYSRTGANNQNIGTVQSDFYYYTSVPGSQGANTITLNGNWQHEAEPNNGQYKAYVIINASFVYIDSISLYGTSTIRSNIINNGFLRNYGIMNFDYHFDYGSVTLNGTAWFENGAGATLSSTSQRQTNPIFQLNDKSEFHNYGNTIFAGTAASLLASGNNTLLNGSSAILKITPACTSDKTTCTNRYGVKLSGSADLSNSGTVIVDANGGNGMSGLLIDSGATFDQSGGANVTIESIGDDSKGVYIKTGGKFVNRTGPYSQIKSIVTNKADSGKGIYNNGIFFEGQNAIFYGNAPTPNGCTGPGACPTP